MRKEKDPELDQDQDPYLWLMDPGDPKSKNIRILRIRIPNTGGIKMESRIRIGIKSTPIQNTAYDSKIVTSYLQSLQRFLQFWETKAAENKTHVVAFVPIEDFFDLFERIFVFFRFDEVPGILQPLFHLFVSHGLSEIPDTRILPSLKINKEINKALMIRIRFRNEFLLYLYISLERGVGEEPK